jgi:hypothetical protein
MSSFVRRLIILCTGLLGGLAAWPLAELVVRFQGSFPSYRLFIPILGAAVGALLGAFFGAAEGITARVRSRIPTGMLVGAAVGCAGGAAGFLAGQAAQWFVGELVLRSYRNFRWVVLPVSRAVGWALLGVFVGMGEGFRAASLKKTLVGALGGLVGGLVGGFVLEYSRLLFPGFAYFRLVGLVVLGLAIGLAYGLIERGLSAGVLRVLTGRLKGKEFPINQSRFRIGSGPRNAVDLSGYESVAERQALVRVRRGQAVLVNLEPRFPVLVNERPVEEHTLKYEDVVRIGAARMFYRYE